MSVPGDLWTCPLCERDLQKAALTLGATSAEMRKFHMEIHRGQMMDRVWNRAATQEEMQALNRIEDWANGSPS